MRGGARGGCARVTSCVGCHRRDHEDGPRFCRASRYRGGHSDGSIVMRSCTAAAAPSSVALQRRRWSRSRVSRWGSSGDQAREWEASAFCAIRCDRCCSASPPVCFASTSAASAGSSLASCASTWANRMTMPHGLERAELRAHSRRATDPLSAARRWIVRAAHRCREI